MWIPFVFEAVAIITGNVTVLVVFTRTPSLRKRKHYLLVSLAVADLLVGLVSLPMYVMLISSVSTSETIGRIYNILDILFGTASVFGLTAVATERVYAVYFPFKHRTLRKGAYIIGITVVWLMAALLATSKIYPELPTFNATVAFMLISLFIVMFSYTSIWIKMNCVTTIQNHAIPRRDKKFTITLFIVTVISLIAWIPFLVVNLLLSCYPRCFRFVDLETMVWVTKICHYGNSFVNPVIYALRMPQFRNSLLYLLQCSVCHRNNEIYGNGTQNHDNLRNYGNNSSDHGNDGSDHGNNDSDHGNNDSDHENKGSDHGNNDSDHGNVVEISRNILSRETSV